MPKTIIESFPKESWELNSETQNSILKVAECFSQTIQGEGIWTGVPSTFLRLQGCTLRCQWCDSLEVWRNGNPYTVEELIDLFEIHEVFEDFKNGHHLVLTGGSPLKQQESLVDFIYAIEDFCGIKPFIEVENECVLEPLPALCFEVDWWNCSPKLENSGMRKSVRYKPDVIREMNNMKNASFKFVISNEDDWNEVIEDFIDPFNINKDKIFLMPEGQTREELQPRYDWLVDLACREGVRISDRLHVTMWNKKTGV